MIRSLSRRPLVFVLVVVTLLGLVYVKHLSNGFTHDDHYQIERNPHLRAEASWWSPFRESVWEFNRERGGHQSYYRPLMFVLFRVANVVGGGGAFAFHALSLLLHALCVFLGYRVIRELGVTAETAKPAILLFAAHPLAAEHVFWIASLQEGIVLTGLLAAIVATRWRERATGATRLVATIAVALAAATAMLGKETGVIVAPILVALAWRGDLANRGRRLLATIPVWLVSFAYLVVRSRALSAAIPAGDRPALAWSLGRAGRALLWYAKTLFFPYPLSPVAGFPLDRNFGAIEICGIATLVLVAIALVVFLCRRPDDAVWTLWFGLPLLLPLANFFSASRTLSAVAERHLYVPLLLWCVVVVALGRRWLPTRARMGVWLLSLSLAAVMTARYGAVFADDFAYFSRAYETAPLNPLVVNQLGAESRRRGDLGAAAKLWREALALDPPVAQAFLNLGTLELERGKIAESVPLLQRAVESEPDFAGAHLLYGRALLGLHRLAEARVELDRAMTLDSTDPTAPFLLGNLHFTSGDPRAAEVAWEKTLQRVPTHALALYNLAKLRMDRGDMMGARPYVERFVSAATTPELQAARAEALAFLEATRR